MRITNNHPVREALVNNVPTYHPNKGRLLAAVESVLRVHGIEAIIREMPGDSGHAVCDLQPVEVGCTVCDACGDRMDRAYYDNKLVLSWYTLESGRVELTCYIS